MSNPAAGLGLPSLTARSIVLSTLLGTHPPQLTARDLVRVGMVFDVGETTLRAALSRMVAAGDLVNVGSTYRLPDHLHARQRRQDASLQPAERAWRGHFEVAVVTSTGRAADARASLRLELVALRLAELREGVWMRPANLRRAWPEHLSSSSRRLRAVPEDPAAELVATLWDLPAWSARGAALLGADSTSRTPAAQFTLAAAVLRHLGTDPVLPAELQPVGWPAADLRLLYARLHSGLAEITAITVSGG